jgi:hypothetical protein
MSALGDEFFVQTFTTTLQKYEKQLVDNVLLDHPTLDLFKANAKSHTGRGLVVPLRAANLGATGYTDASGTHATSVSDNIMGSAVYDFANGIITPFRVKHRDVLMNTGPEQIVNLVEEYVKAAAADHGDFITQQLHRAASDYSAGELLPLAALIGNADTDDADGIVVGGIDPNVAGKEYWQSTVLESFRNDEDIITSLRRLTNAIYMASRKRPTNFIVGINVFEEVEFFLQEKGQYMNPQGTAQTRFQEIKFGELSVRLDPDCDADTVYAIHAPSLRLGYAAGEFMKAYPAQPLQGTLDTVVPLASTLVIGTAERRAHGRIVRVNGSSSDSTSGGGSTDSGSGSDD